MKYHVRWSPTAEDELTDLWVDAKDRSVVSAAAAAIDHRLAANAENEGESRAAGIRILFSAPLAATYEVNPRTRQVYVAHIWRYRVG
ncbi:MAG TPA: hypothetical protein VNH11_10230 [Pirellulales bacterium]|nr:hypothetical protein [Pirellulales bacterium]